MSIEMSIASKIGLMILNVPMVTEEEPDIIGLTETLMKEASSIEGYHPSDPA